MNVITTWIANSKPNVEKVVKVDELIRAAVLCQEVLYSFALTYCVSRYVCTARHGPRTLKEKLKEAPQRIACIIEIVTMQTPPTIQSALSSIMV